VRNELVLLLLCLLKGDTYARRVSQQCLVETRVNFEFEFDSRLSAPACRTFAQDNLAQYVLDIIGRNDWRY